MKRLFILLIFIAQNVIAGSGNQLLGYCPELEKSEEWGYCVGYVVAIADVESPKSKKDFCIPPAVVQSQLAKVAVKWLIENPDKLHYAANSLVLAALAQAFPCKK